MRFEKGHKENTRRRIIDVAAKKFRRDGIAASGLAGIMSASGLTNGAFYPHFESKEALVKEALSSALQDQQDALTNEDTGAADIEDAIRRYLNTSHLVGYEEGCPSAALLPEIGRQPETTRQRYEQAVLAYVDGLAGLLPDPKRAKRREQAIAIFGLMVGTLQIARAVSDHKLAEAILEGGVQAALTLAHPSGPPGKVPPGSSKSVQP
ncbi:TetR family transcriptional regulator [Bordetella genomosp. 8]|uniref:TetR family transcriptional regulator n=1 Tax=Bordetella genomosp. 8 TaxID=1416806 RepID=A0A1W6YMU4_9BORD|nr:TetR/AcrR family transcriptional regulator [Bordetella genomosp. 8]ARP82314.1 TetR family transcriptional regulator [Bordetella genomosp. 8]